MRISHKRSKSSFGHEKRHRTNQFIKAPQVRVVDEHGENLGVMDTNKALAIAQDRGLDLIEVSPLAEPPVAKIVDYSKLKYQEEKERRKERAKQKRIEIKGIRLSLRISEHDLQVRVGQAIKFLGQDDKVRLEMLLRGRERQHSDLAKNIIHKFIESVSASVPAGIEQPLSFQGGKLSVIIAKK